MKKIFTVMLVACALVACKPEKMGRINGTIKDASMNTVVVQSLTSDSTYVFSTENADMTDARGMLLGNVIVVDYKGNLADVTSATKVVTDPTYANAVGQWTMVDPINPNGKLGVDIMVEGAASSINMATQQYKTWELKGPENEIILYGQSIGNGQTIDFIENAKLVQKDGKWWLVIEGTEWMLEKESM